MEKLTRKLTFMRRVRVGKERKSERSQKRELVFFHFSLTPENQSPGGFEPRDLVEDFGLFLLSLRGGRSKGAFTNYVQRE